MTIVDILRKDKTVLECKRIVDKWPEWKRREFGLTPFPGIKKKSK